MTIETTGVVEHDRSMTLKLPDEFPAGACRVVVVSEPPPEAKRIGWAEWPAHNIHMVNPSETFRREDLYADD